MLQNSKSFHYLCFTLLYCMHCTKVDTHTKDNKISHEKQKQTWG